MLEWITRKIRGIGRRLVRLFAVLHHFMKLRAAANPRFRLTWRDRWLHLKDASSTTPFDRHYVLHTAWASRVLAETKPAAHVDIGSTLYFIVSVSAFIPIRFIDFRPANLGLSGVTVEPGDICNLPFADESVASLSCMHVLEHIGLGRYGDPLDYDGDLKGAAELTRVLAPGGTLLIVVPVTGWPRIQFNAHRIYSYGQILSVFDRLDLVEFALIPDDGSDDCLIRGASEALANRQTYGCGCFLFKKNPRVRQSGTE